MFCKDTVGQIANGKNQEVMTYSWNKLGWENCILFPISMQKNIITGLYICIFHTKYSVYIYNTPIHNCRIKLSVLGHPITMFT